MSCRDHVRPTYTFNGNVHLFKLNVIKGYNFYIFSVVKYNENGILYDGEGIIVTISLDKMLILFV